MEKIETICCVSGKSGGHIIPNLQWAQHYNKDARILFFSANTSLDYHLLAGKVTTHVPLNLQIGSWYMMPLFLINFVYATFISVWYLIRHKPHTVLSTGSITALPVCIAAYCLRIPIELFELNAVPGSATRWLAPLAQKIHVCFESAHHYFDPKKVTISNYPIRFKKEQYKQLFEDQNNRKTIFIQGGSQGSVSLNNKIKSYIEENPHLYNHLNIIHQTGPHTTTDWKQFYAQKNIPAIVFEFEDDLQRYYQAADLIICRAGAGQLFESLYFKKQCITIPLELAYNTHQLDNALAITTLYPQLFTVIRQHAPLPKGIL